MQEMEEKETQSTPKKWTSKEEELLKTMLRNNSPLEEIERQFPKHKREDLRKKYDAVAASLNKESEN
jgi:hypothetical protein